MSEPMCEWCEAGSKPYLVGYGNEETRWGHEGGVLCQTPEKNCTCHLGSICNEACDRGKHHDGCASAK